VNPAPAKPTAAFTYSPLTGITTATDVTFSNTGTGATGYVWKVNGILEAATAAFSKTFATPNNYTVRLVATSASGCKDSTEKTVTVGTVPCTPPATPSLADISVCQGDALTQAIPSPATPGNTYVWYTQATGGTATTPDFSTAVAATRTYYVAERTPLNGGCQSAGRGVFVFTIRPRPVADVNPKLAGYCPTDAGATLTAADAGVGATYEWFKDGTSLGLPGTSNVLTSATVGSYTVAVELKGCPATSATPAVVSLSTGIVPTVKIKASSLDTCQGSIVQVGVVSQSAGTIQWFQDGVAKGSGNQHSFTLSAATKIRAVLTSSASCATPSTASDSLVAKVKTAPVPSVLLTSDKQNVCTGTPVTFNAAPADGLSYEWYVGGAKQSSTSPTFSSSQLVNGDVVRVVYRSPQACADPATAEDTLKVYLKPTVTPSVKMKPAPSKACAGETLSVEAIPSGQGGNPVYTWYVNGTPSVTSTPMFSTGISAATNLYVSLASDAACASPALVYSDTLSIGLDNALTPLVEIEANKTVVCENDKAITFSISKAQGLGSTPSYQWFRNGSPLNGETNPGLAISTPLDGDKITLYATSASACRTKDGDSSNTVALQVKNAPRATILLPVANGGTHNTGQPQVSLRADADSPGGYEAFWEKTGQGALANITGALNSLGGLSVAGTTEVRWVVWDKSAVCPPDTARIYIAYSPGPWADAGTDQEKCVTDVPVLNGTGSATGTWSSLTAGADIAASGATATVTQKVIGDNLFRYCVEGTCDTVKVTVTDVPSGTGGITGTDTACANSEHGYSYPLEPTATEYRWSVPDGAAIVGGAGTNSVTVRFGASSGNVQVSPGNGCGLAAPQSLSVAIKTVPTDPVTLTGDFAPCGSQKAVPYQAVTTATGTSFVWSTTIGGLSPSGNTATIDFSSTTASSGTLDVRLSNECGLGSGGSEVLRPVAPVNPSLTLTSDKGNDFCIGETTLSVRAVPVNGGTNPVYSFTLNNTAFPATGNEATFSPADLGSGAIVGATMVSNAACLLDPATATATATLTLNAVAAPTPTILSTGNGICEGDPQGLRLSASGEGTRAVSYSWYKDGLPLGISASTLLLQKSSEAGQYELKMDNGICAERTSAPLQAIILPRPTIDMPAKLEVEITADGKTPIALSATVMPANSTLSWSGQGIVGASDKSGLVLRHSREGIFPYTLVATSQTCSTTQSLELVVRLPFKIPNAFTPNGDGLNDTWVYLGLVDYEYLKVSVFNRWGGLLYRAEGERVAPWEGVTNGGQPLEAGTYYYILEVRKNGRTENYDGHVTILH
jgi:gliding motility-associated-like protein